MDSESATRRILITSIAAAIVNGLLAGGNVDRAIVARPAWSGIGLVAWAEYSRHADLGNGQMFYPAMAIGGTLLCIVAAILFLRAGRVPGDAAWPVLLGAGLMVICLPISFVAAPFILSLRHIDNQDVTALRGAFDGSFFWGRFQMALHVLSFFANLWAISALSRNDSARTQRPE
jgi:hypothetical protein